MATPGMAQAARRRASGRAGGGRELPAPCPDRRCHLRAADRHRLLRRRRRRQLQRVRDDQGRQEGQWMARIMGLALNCTPHCILAFVAAAWLTQVCSESAR